MKKSNFVMLLLAVVCYLPLHATPDLAPSPRAKTKLVEGKTIQLALMNLQKKTTRVSITDLNGNTEYFLDVIKDHNGYRKELNLEKLSQGTYILTVKNNKEVLRQVISVKEDRIFFSHFS